MLHEDTIVAEFKAVIKRGPTADEMSNLSAYKTADGLRAAIASIPDFYLSPMVRRGYEVSQYRRLNSQLLPVQVEASPEEMADLYAATQRAWESMGTDEPWWSVVSNEIFLTDSFEGREEQFYASGAEQVDVLLRTLQRSGHTPDDFPVIMEIGCGVGRMTEHFAKHFKSVIAVDISQPHIDLAAQRMRKIGADNVKFVHIKRPSDYGSIGNVDLVFSYLVLQHSTPPIINAALDMTLAKLNEGGATYIHVPTFIEGYTFAIKDYLSQTKNEMEMHAIPQRAVFSLFEKHGLSLYEAINDGSGGDYRFEVFRYFAAKR